MHRRALLATVGAATVGGRVVHARRDATRRPGGQECDVAIEDAAVEYHPAVPNAPEVTAEIAIDPGSCEGEVVASVHAGGTEWVRRRLELAASDQGTHYVSQPQPDFPLAIDAATVRIATLDGTVLAERAVEVADYREDPGRFRIQCASVDDRSVRVDEPARVTVTVGNDGYAPDYEARLLVGEGGEVVDRVEQSTHGMGDDAPDDPDCPGQTVSLSHAFDEPGAYVLRVRLVPDGEGGTGDTRSLGTVTVDDGVSVGPLAVVGAFVGGALLAWRRRTRRDSGRE